MMNTLNKLTALAGLLLLCLLLAGISLPAVTVGSNNMVIKFGVLPVNQPEVMVKRFEPLIAYLEKETGYDFELITYPTDSKSGGYSATVKGLLSGETPFAYLAPVTISQARFHDRRIQPIVCAVRAGSATYVGQIAVRNDSDIFKIEDLIGRRVVGASPSSTSGNLLPSGMLIEKGISKTQFAAMDFAGGHDKAANGVLNGTYDAAWINDKNFQKFKNVGKGMRAIWEHAPVPEFPITVNARFIDPKKLAKIRDALLNMHTLDLAALQAIDPKYERWTRISWRDYQPIKETIDKVYGKEFYALKE